MRIFAVGEIGLYVKELFRADEFLSDVWVSGEVTNLSRSGAGHYYFTLKDEASQLRSVLFRGAALRCGAEPRAGDEVVAHGKVAFYERTGACELCVDLLYPSGVGEAQLRFEALRLKLEEEGLFAPDRKRPLPEYPRRIGLVTSEGGAVLHDVLTILTRRYPIAEVVFVHSAVQGAHAAVELVAALGRLRDWRGPDGTGIDVVIVGRGGGSPEELAAFNDERVARSVFGSPWPIISAVGHETDVTICDYVADVRAATPSAAAELVAPNLQLVAEEVRELARAAQAAVGQAVQAAHGALGRGRDRLLVHTPSAQIARSRQATEQEYERAHMLLMQQVGRAREQLVGRRLQLAALSPTATLARGYSVLSAVPATGGSDRVVRSVGDVPVPSELRVQLLDGVVDARSTGIRRAVRADDRARTAAADAAESRSERSPDGVSATPSSGE